MDTYQGDLIFNQVFDLDIRMFLLLYETRSFSKTAQIVGCNQPAVSKRISKLEESLGITLFDRSQRPIRPTSSARILYSEMKKSCGKNFRHHRSTSCAVLRQTGTQIRKY